jgi:hypothetical protein
MDSLLPVILVRSERHITLPVICLSDLGNILAYYLDKITLISLLYWVSNCPGNIPNYYILSSNKDIQFVSFCSDIWYCNALAYYLGNIYRLIHGHFHIGLVIIPRPPYWPETQSSANMGRGMITEWLVKFLNRFNLLLHILNITWIRSITSSCIVSEL